LAPLVFEPVQIRLKAPITQTAPVAASRLTAAIATTVLTGWILQIDPLKNFAPGMIAMNPITAGGLIAASVALFLREAPDASKKGTILGQALAAGVIVLGVCVLLLSRHDPVTAKWLTLPPLSDGSLVEANGARISLELCFDRRLNSGSQLQNRPRISSGRTRLCRHRRHRDSFPGGLFSLSHRLLYHLPLTHRLPF
jgi:hypothetical protein